MICYRCDGQGCRLSMWGVEPCDCRIELEAAKTALCEAADAWNVNDDDTGAHERLVLAVDRFRKAKGAG